MRIGIDAGKPVGAIGKYWTKCVGSCHAATALREDWRAQLRKCREELGFEYVRFHGLLDDDMSVCVRRSDGSLEYSFFNVDSIFDFLLGIGMKPFVELGFMPGALASGSKTVFHYKGNITPPASYDDWAALIGALAAHLVERYGAAEVRGWFFEVWNEPNLDFFWAGTRDDYFRLYRGAALAIKAVDPALKVGGPATAIDAWIPELREFCEEGGLPLDFISTHHYPTDAAFGLDMGLEEQMARAERGVLGVRARKALGEAGHLPLYYTEWNCSPSPRDPYHDLPYNAAFVVKSIGDNLGLLGCYSYWTFSDIFEECGQSSVPFHGGFGLLNVHGIPKPAYRAFQLLSRLEGERLEVAVGPGAATVDCLASRGPAGLTILLSNHHVPRATIGPERIELRVSGAGGFRSAWLERIDEEHANPEREWREMGSPTYLDAARIDRLMKASELRREKVVARAEGDSLVLDLTIAPHSVVSVVLESGA
jgi:xylan 1,4-beta-xylosidase